jgi:hypothetical protein
MAGRETVMLDRNLIGAITLAAVLVIPGAAVFASAVFASDNVKAASAAERAALQGFDRPAKCEIQPECGLRLLGETAPWRGCAAESP